MPTQESQRDKTRLLLLGDGLRQAREKRGWKRDELASRLSSDISETAIRSYELGYRHVTAMRLIEICEALGVSAAEIIDDVCMHANALTVIPIQVNLRQVAKSTSEPHDSVRQWAKGRLRTDPSTGSVLLGPSAVRELSPAFGLTHMELAAFLFEHSDD